MISNSAKRPITSLFTRAGTKADAARHLSAISRRSFALRPGCGEHPNSTATLSCSTSLLTTGRATVWSTSIQHRSSNPAFSSMAAPIIDRAFYHDRTNLENSSLSYYLKGELIALNLDLLIRGRTKGQRSLDDVMRRAYDEFYLKSPNASYYLKGRGYTVEDFKRIVSQVAGMDMTGWFEKYVRGVETLPYDESLDFVGLRLEKTAPSEPYTAGIRIDREDRQALRLGTLRPGSPAENGGLQQGDILVSIGGTTVSRDNWRNVLNRYKEGDRIPVTARRFDQVLQLTIQLGPPEVYEYRIEEMPAAPAEARKLRAAWLEGN